LAQDLAGTWQGTIKPPKGKELRAVYKVANAEKGGQTAVMYSIDQGGQPIPVGAVTRQGANVKFDMPQLKGGFEGKFTADGNSIEGTWKQGKGSTSLNLVRATPETAWAIPEPPPPPKPMIAEDPSFEVATIKPSEPGRPGKAFTVRGRQVLTINTTLNDLMVFAYGIHSRQIEGGPGWVSTDKYDITAQPDAEGAPNGVQLRTMMQKLMAERFELSFHREQKELSVYAIRRGDGEPKLTKNESGNPLPGLFFQGLGNLPARNATMSDFAGVMQGAVLDRPVVDQTGIEGRYDFVIRRTPDEFQFAALGGVPSNAKQNKGGETFPDLFTAMREQLNLKLESTRAPAEVFVIDKVERPSEN
jgi:uncharacterized protein (TIGR03435 family)